MLVTRKVRDLALNQKKLIKMSSPAQLTITKIYRRLFQNFGPQHWWPGDTPFEIIVGAILTQNTNWGNVEKAIRNLKQEKLLTPQALHTVTQSHLASLIKPAGYFNVKTKRIKNFVNFLFAKYGGDLKRMKRVETPALRKELLSVNGIGPETADSILLYAFDKPAFVIDAYTKRIFYRHNLVGHNANYHQVQELLTANLSRDVKIFNEYHALIVRLGKDFCRTKPRCESCPLKNIRYSAANRCRHCYRAFVAGEKRFSFKKSEGHFCRNCKAGVF